MIFDKFVLFSANCEKSTEKSVLLRNIYSIIVCVELFFASL